MSNHHFQSDSLLFAVSVCGSVRAQTEHLVVLHEREENVPEDGDAVDVGHPEVGAHAAEVVVLGGRPQQPVELEGIDIT